MIRRLFLCLTLCFAALPVWAQDAAPVPTDAPTAATATPAAPVTITDPENTLIMQLKYGRVVIQMRPDLAPHHVARIKELVRKGFYDKLVFHRVIADFMAQTGDPTGTGRGGSGKFLKAEFSEEHHVRGTVSMARAMSNDSADSQFFICLADQPELDGQYTIWGQVIDGMNFVDQIKKGDPDDDGMVHGPDKMLWLKVAADVKDKPDEKPAHKKGQATAKSP